MEGPVTRQNKILTALINKGGEVKGSREDILEVLRQCKKHKVPIIGSFKFDVDGGMKGTNVRKRDTTSGAAMYKLFAECASACVDKLKKPLYDEGWNGLVSTDGRMMLVSRIPAGLTKEAAANAGFCADAILPYRWSQVAGEMEHDPYVLSFYDHVGDIRKGSEEHGLLQFMTDCSKAYAYSDDVRWRDIFVKIGEKIYNTRFLSTLTDALFGLGCDKVGFYEAPNGSLHIFGFGNGFDSKGVVMPLRDTSADYDAVFALPTDTANRVAA